MPQKTYILSTKQVPYEIIQAAAADNIVIEVDTFIKTDHVISPAIIRELCKQKINVVFTSVQGVAAVGLLSLKEKPDWKVFCIGQATASFIRSLERNYEIAGTADNAAALAEVIIQCPNISEVTYFCGRQRRPELPEILTARNVKVNEVVVYNTIMLPHYVKRQYDGILFFSPSSVEAFFSLNNINKSTVLFSIGNTTGNAIKEFTNNTLVTADVPSLEGLIHQAVNHFKSARTLR